MNDNDFHREDENTTEEPRVSSVEYGPYDHNAYYGQTKKNKGTVAILIACAVILLVAIFAAAGALLFGGSGEIQFELLKVIMLVAIAIYVVYIVALYYISVKKFEKGVNID